jgi:hypothetical protein
MTIGLFNVLALAQEYPEYPEPGAGAIAALGVGILIVWLAILIVVSAFLWWKVFTKAGQPGWASIIPIYNFFVLLKIAGRPWWWFFILWLVIPWFIVHIDIAKRFGKEVGFGIGLALLGVIFFPILGFGPATYKG